MLWKVEKGDPSVAIGICAAVLHALNNRDTGPLLVAKDDAKGWTMQDLKLFGKERRKNEIICRQEQGCR